MPGRIRPILLLAAALLMAPLQMGGCVVPPSNSAPVAQSQTVDAVAGTALTIELRATDANAGDTLTYTIRSLPQHGTLTDGIGTAIVAAPHELTGATVRYLAGAEFAGSDSFTFTASDGSRDSGAATVSIDVTSADPPATTIISEDMLIATFWVPDGTITEIRNNAVVTVNGDADIAGTLRATDGRITLRVDGDLTIDGLLRSIRSDDAELDENVPLGQQPVGITIIAGDGAVTFSEDSSVQTDGAVVVTDDDAVLDRTPVELFAEIEDVSSDEMPTLVPLPPDNPIFADGAPKPILAPSPGADTSPTIRQVIAPAPVTLSGVWPPAGAAAPAGDQPVWIFRFDGNRPLNLDDWTVNGPTPPDRPEADQSAMPGDNATGRGGKSGLRLNIWNNGGAINVTGTVTLNLAPGGAGGPAMATCASATGGNGGAAGNFRMSASGGINVSNGILRINPGPAGSGGAATVQVGAAGAAGCPGATGDAATATGGNGGENRKRIFARGNVQGLGNVQIGPIVAGDGGNATAESCDGGDGLACCDGGAGGAATAIGGSGGEASLNLTGVAVNGSAATVTGGAGGMADATAALGGNGGDCKFSDAGDGGDGGAATAIGGAGGAAVSSGGAGSTGGNGGDAVATGGDGGDGGDSGFGQPGFGGFGGIATATAGAGGAGDTAGTAGDTDPLDGLDGLNGGALPVVIFCLPFGGLVDGTGVLTPGVYNIPVLNEDESMTLGSVPVNFRDTAGAEFATSDSPAPHFGFANAQVDVRAGALQLDQGAAGVIGGVRITPLSGQGISEMNPLVVQAYDADNQFIAQQLVTSLPDNFGDVENPESVDVTFDVDESITTFRIIAPPGTFVTVLRIYLLDP
jgi:hypothetical protein